MTYILHIDTSAGQGHIMLSGDGNVLAHQFSRTGRDHAESIEVMIGEVLKAAGLDMDQLSAVSICGGPGSYTGLRIGMATAKGICYALDKPLIVYSKLALLINKSANFLNYSLILLPARAGEYFIALYKENEIILSPQHAPVWNVNEYISSYNAISVTGKAESDIVMHEGVVYNENLEIDPGFWASESFKGFKNKTFANLASIEPLYMKSVFIQNKTI